MNAFIMNDIMSQENENLNPKSSKSKSDLNPAVLIKPPDFK